MTGLELHILVLLLDKYIKYNYTTITERADARRILADIFEIERKAR